MTEISRIINSIVLSVFQIAPIAFSIDSVETDVLTAPIISSLEMTGIATYIMDISLVSLRRVDVPIS